MSRPYGVVASLMCAPGREGGAHGVVNTPLSCDRVHGNG